MSSNPTSMSEDLVKARIIGRKEKVANAGASSVFVYKIVGLVMMTPSWDGRVSVN